jgi:hypothetical protein
MPPASLRRQMSNVPANNDGFMRMKSTEADIKLRKNAFTENATGLAADAFQETCNDDARERIARLMPEKWRNKWPGLRQSSIRPLVPIR